MASQQPIITYDYDASPYGQKIRMLLALTGLPYKRCDVPIVLPRPQLESIGITYRRIPVLAVGKDVYCDTGAIMAKIMELQGPQGKVAKHPADAAFEQWANWAFQITCALIPSQLLTPEFIKDRQTVFPIVARPDFNQLRPSGLGAFASVLHTVENDFLSSGYPYIGGRKDPSTADVHVAFILRWPLMRLGVKNEPGFGEQNFPKTYAWLASLPQHQPEALDAETSKETILRSDYSVASPQDQSDDPIHSLVSKDVNVENADTAPGAHPQLGKLVSANIHEFVIELQNGIRVHFPRTGFFVKPQSASAKHNL